MKTCLLCLVILKSKLNFDKDNKADVPKVKVKSEIDQTLKERKSDGTPKPVHSKIKLKPVVKWQNKPPSSKKKPVAKLLSSRRKN